MKISLTSLLSKRTFLPLFLTQFFGAFNDNAFKLATLTLISYFLTTSQAQSENYQAIAAALFILPFFLFSAVAGQLADKYNKASVTRCIKILEIVLMTVGGVGLYFGHIMIMMIILTGMGIHSTFFGPIKYAILPDHLPKKELMSATALIEGSTFLAILLGTTLGTLSIGGAKTGTLYAIGLTVGAAVSGFLSSWFIPSAPPNASDLKIDWHIPRATLRMLKDVFDNQRIILAIIAISWFWMIGIIVLTKLPDYANYVLQAETSVFAVFLALFSIGIALGSLTINQLLSGQFSLRYTPYIMLFLSLFACDLYWATPVYSDEMALQTLTEFLAETAHVRVMVDLFFLALSGGMYIVPLYTCLQIESKGMFRARTIAANNIINALFMVTGTLLVMILLHYQLSIPQVFLVTGVLNALAALGFWFWLMKLNTASLD